MLTGLRPGTNVGILAMASRPMIITARYASFGMFLICNYGHIAYYVIPPSREHALMKPKMN